MLAKLHIGGSDATRSIHPNGKSGADRFRTVVEFVRQVDVPQQPSGGRHGGRGTGPNHLGETLQFVALLVIGGDHQNDFGVARLGVSGRCPSQVVAIYMNDELLGICRRGLDGDVYCVVDHGAGVGRNQVAHQPARRICRVHMPWAALEIVAGAGYHREVGAAERDLDVPEFPRVV